MFRGGGSKLAYVMREESCLYSAPGWGIHCSESVNEFKFSNLALQSPLEVSLFQDFHSLVSNGMSWKIKMFFLSVVFLMANLGPPILMHRDWPIYLMSTVKLITFYIAPLHPDSHLCNIPSNPRVLIGIRGLRRLHSNLNLTKLWLKKADTLEILGVFTLRF